MSSLGNSSNYNTAAVGGSSGGSGGHWTDSLPRRDFYSNIAPTGSLPRRDKAGLGRPEPPRLQQSQPQKQQPPQDNGLKGNNLRRRDLSLNRDNTSTFRDAFTGNKGKNGITLNIPYIAEAIGEWACC